MEREKNKQEIVNVSKQLIAKADSKGGRWKKLSYQVMELPKDKALKISGKDVNKNQLSAFRSALRKMSKKHYSGRRTDVCRMNGCIYAFKRE